MSVKINEFRALPRRSEMISRLLKLESDPIMHNYLYPVILKSENLKFSPLGLVSMMFSAVMQCMSLTKIHAVHSAHSVYLIRRKIPEIIRILIDDVDFTVNAIAIFHEICED